LSGDSFRKFPKETGENFFSFLRRIHFRL
jgi:hypothetical protein